jgi:hypothetical protein
LWWTRGGKMCEMILAPVLYSTEQVEGMVGYLTAMATERH